MASRERGDKDKSSSPGFMKSPTSNNDIILSPRSSEQAVKDKETIARRGSNSIYDIYNNRNVERRNLTSVHFAA